ncbi:uncharacterized protein LOC131624360 [Vicia villosa]|uniref:uncharacterized protein LOC131624360 n=1 Tax=Vicia villosa TaxID=3911 RepID=UPI00273B2DD0|nr:uncharacterized protein LOC131624360 [Vicia villosa]
MIDFDDNSPSPKKSPKRNNMNNNSKIRSFQQDMLDPYYMHPSDKPGLSIVTPPLNNTNFHSWSRSLKLAFMSKNKLWFIDGTLNRPDISDPNHVLWNRCNNMVMTWITNSIYKEIYESVLWIDSAKEIWEELHERYHQGDIFRISDLQEKSMHKNKEFDNFCPLPSCQCDPVCHCQLLPSIKTYRENDYIIRFLKGLNDQYAHVRSQIMLISPLPSDNKVFSMQIQQERQTSSPVPDEKLIAHIQNPPSKGRSTYASTKPSYNPKSKGLKICTYCNKLGHTIEVFFKKHGLSSYLKKTNIALATSDEPGTEEGTSGPSKDSSKNIGFTAEQQRALLALLQQNNAFSAPNIQHLQSPSASHPSISHIHNIFANDQSEWLLNTGATSHGTHTLMKIGAAKIHNGLYTLTSPFIPLNKVIYSTINNCTLWHNRLGHTFYETIVQINKNFPLSNLHKSHEPCDTFFSAKQKRLPFYNSDTSTLHCFDLIHMDIWGPISNPSINGHKYFLTIVDDHSR